VPDQHIRCWCHEANLTGAWLDEADLTGAQVTRGALTKKQLAEASNVELIEWVEKGQSPPD
jgi:uncharacterized protein YjbI with pentapeptide repeats